MVFRSTQIAAHLSSQRFQFTSKLAMNHHCSQISTYCQCSANAFQIYLFDELVDRVLRWMCLADLDAAS